MSQITNLGSAVTSGSLVLLSSQTVSGASAATFTSVVTTKYDDYVLRYNGVTSTTGTFLLLQFSTNNGVSYLNGANYSTTGYFRNSAAAGNSYSGAATSIDIGDKLDSGGTSQVAGITNFFNISSGNVGPVCTSFGQCWGNQNNLFSYGGLYNSAIAVNAFQVFSDTGTISGTFKLYGVVK